MINCKTIRVNDQYHCSCGFQWDVGEYDPHPMTATEVNKRREKQLIKLGLHRINRNIGNKALAAIKENLNRE